MAQIIDMKGPNNFDDNESRMGETFDRNESYALSSGTKLQPFENITSRNGRYELRLQKDSNFVLYENSYKAIWASDTWKASGTQGMADYVTLRKDGNLVIIGKSGNVMWESTVLIKKVSLLSMIC